MNACGRTAWAVALWALGASACFSPLCTQQETLTRPDAGPYVCLKAEDCPRPSNTFVCTNTDDRVLDCIDCVQTQCVRFSQGKCE